MTSDFFKHKLPALLLALIMLTSLSACGDTASDGSSGSTDSSVSSSDAGSIDSGYSITSLEDFKTAAASYGEVQDVTETVGYEAAIVSGDSLNIIYMMLPDADTAKSVALGDVETGSDIQTVSSGSNYDFYEEHATEDADTDISAFYGYYVRVDNMLILTTGALESEASVKEQAAEFYRSLGYTNA